MAVSFILVFVAILLAAVASASFSTLAFAVIAYALCILFCKSIDFKIRNKAYFTLNVVFALVVLFATFHYLDAINNWNDWHYSGYGDNRNAGGNDEWKFWMHAEHMAQLPLIQNVIGYCFDYTILMENRGYMAYIGILSWLAEHFGDGNNLLMLFLSSALFVALLSVVMFKIFVLFFNEQKSCNYALIYSIFSTVFFYGLHLYRDTCVAFFYVLNSYICLKKFSFRNLFLLLLNIIIVWQLRVESGLFAITFACLYAHQRLNKYKWLVFVFVLIVASFFFMYFYLTYMSVSEAMEHYQDFTIEEATEVQGSLAALLFHLPSPFKEIALFFNSQIQPFPSWVAITRTNNLYGAAVEGLRMIYGVFKFFTFFSLVLWIRSIKKLPQDVVWLLLIALIFFILNLSNPNDRRMMSMYPVIFISYVLIKEKIIPNYRYKRTGRLLSLTYIGGILLYLIIKI